MALGTYGPTTIADIQNRMHYQSQPYLGLGGKRQGGHNPYLPRRSVVTAGPNNALNRIQDNVFGLVNAADFKPSSNNKKGGSGSGSGSNKRKLKDLEQQLEAVRLKGTAGRNDLGWPGVNFVKSTTCALRAHHRSSPIPYQVSVVHNCTVERSENVYARRLAETAGVDPSMLIAPVGTVDCYIVKKGELVFHMQDESGGPRRTTHSYDGYPDVFATVNGLLATQRIMFAGYMAFNQYPAMRHPDTTGTLVVAGTVSVYHTGPYPIRAGALVYFSKYPYVRENEQGQKQPAIEIVGEPGELGEETDVNGVSTAKFKPALYQLHDQDTASCIRVLERVISKKLIENRMHELVKNPSGANTILNTIVTIAREVDTELFFMEARELPMRMYAELCTWTKAFDFISGSLDAALEKEISIAFYGILFKHFDIMRKESIHFSDSVGGHVTPFSHDCLRPDTKTKIKEDKYYNDGAGNREDWGHYHLPLHKVLKEWASEGEKFYISYQEDFLRSHIVGQAMRDALPARVLDLLMNMHGGK